MTRRGFSFLLVVVCLATGCERRDRAELAERSAIATEAIGGDAGGLLPTTTSVTSSHKPSTFGQSVTFTARVAGLVGLPLGVVTFTDGASELGSAALNATGRATFTTALLTAGAHAVVATFPGDLIYRRSSSAPLAQQVNPALTKTVLSSSSSPSVAGTPVTLNAIVTAQPPGAFPPSGMVTFADGNVALGTSSIGPGGVATLTTGALAVGSHALTASYSGDAGFTGSMSLGLAQTVNRDGVAVVLVSSANPSVFGASVTFTAKVASAAAGGVPGGDVSFRDGFDVLATETLDASGTVSFETTALEGGSHTISASYEGDANHGSSGIASVTETVTPAPVSVVVTSSVNPTVFAQAVTLTAQVTTMPPGAFDGVVTFFDGSAALGAATVDPSGLAAMTTSSLSIGTHSVTALYGGDSDHAGATSAALSEAVGPIQTTTSIAASSNPAQVDAAVTFAATVSAIAPNVGVPKGTVTFRDGGGSLGDATLDANGVATFTVVTLAAGSHPVTASYGGDQDFSPSASDVLTELVALNATTIAVTSSPNPSTYRALVTIVATVTGSLTTATGKLTFRAGSNVLGDATLDATGAAAFTTATLAVGAHTLSAEYAGDAANAPGSGTLTHIVNAPTATSPADAGMRGASDERPHHDAGIVSGAGAPSVEPPAEAASLGGAASCGCRLMDPRRERLPGYVALALAALILRRWRRRSA